ncbi:hypothetical protein HPB48_001231 [Haemaphysalis longicornis]|uniref:ALMS motif domain-containing protein n=1 Tax=Haemaphysalis longicornis TaxID=44386 RepID=A0A9J6FJT1_HAELO|nr:hypothetical protein HPB48_001231 [Haemaphysalis longicornis]
MHGRAMPSINVGAKATILPQGNAEDASLSRSGESEVSSSPDLLAVPKARQAFAQQNSVTSYDTASEGTSSRLLALQKEVERLHRLEQLFLLADGSRTASSPETQTTEKSSAEVAHGNTESNSAAVQTSESLLVACQQEDAGAKERCFVSVCNAGAKKQRDHLSPRRRKPISRRPVAWVVPFGSDSRYPGNRNNAASPKTSAQQHADKEESLQAAFAARCGHLIERLEARQSQVAVLAEQRRKQQPTAGQAQLQGRTQEQRRPRGLREYSKQTHKTDLPVMHKSHLAKQKQRLKQTYTYSASYTKNEPRKKKRSQQNKNMKAQKVDFRLHICVSEACMWCFT